MDDELTLYEETAYTGRGPFLSGSGSATPHTHPLSSIRMCSPARSEAAVHVDLRSDYSLADADAGADEIILKPRPAFTALPRGVNANTHARKSIYEELTPPASPELSTSFGAKGLSSSVSTRDFQGSSGWNSLTSPLPKPSLNTSSSTSLDTLPNTPGAQYGSKAASKPNSTSSGSSPSRSGSPVSRLPALNSPSLKATNLNLNPGSLFSASNISNTSTQLSAAKFGNALSRAGSVFQRKSQASTPSSSPSHSPVRRHKASKSFADFLGVQGSSAPVSFGLPASFSNTNIPTKKNDEMPIRPQHVRRASTFASITSSLGLRAPSRAAKDEVVDEEDEFLGLDLDAELFPQGMPAQATPAAYDDLLANAEKLFLRMHAAYKVRVREFQEATSKHDVEQQELEDAMTRANHLKLQLTELSARNEDQECTIRSLSQELEGSQRRNMASIRMIHSPILMSDSEIEEGGCERGERLFSNNAFETESEISSAPGSVFSSRPGSADGSTTMTVSTLPTEDERGRATALPMTWSGMREENEALKGRVEELEKVIQLTLGSLSDLGV